jgi:predicted Ser/Thr protein kinase
MTDLTRATSPAVEATQDLAPQGSTAARVVELLDDYLERLKAGEQPDREQLLRDHPELASQLEACLAGLDFIHSHSLGVQPPGRRLGDFRIVREIGHGGMGAVYEAEQISLSRRVALKVLRFGVASDDDAINRFQREAETVARLHHTNIVPIFAVGSEQGVNYYAMQFIEGRSLDRVLREAGQPIPPRQVAEWGLQAAEALAHAHARGVIHRDVKPSNLLIDDAEGRIWLTDFGLAKRLDDVTLSVTGALLGTPRYMSPEQAMAAHSKLDQRTDIYSLGATLYELVTNQPVVSGDTPHDVISKIVGQEVTPPRAHIASLPRDLDTILLKCLAKEPSQRYESARRLADDLRAFLDGRPISARRRNLLELGVRWFQRQKKTVALALVAAAATLGVVLLSAIGGYMWHRSRMARLMLKTDHAPLTAELLDAADERILPPMSLPTLDPVELPAGDYRLRLSGPKRLSETFDVSLERGAMLTRKLDLEGRVLWSDRKTQQGYAVATIATATSDGVLDVHADLFEFTNSGVQRLPGKSGFPDPVWSLALANSELPRLKEQASLTWPSFQRSGTSTSGVGMFEMRPWIVGVPASTANTAWKAWDFNADGTSDLLLADRSKAYVLALSGANGVPLWVMARGDAVAQAGRKEPPPGITGGILDAPLPVGDRNGDGFVDFIVHTTVVDPESKLPQRTLELISGGNGESLWKLELDDALFALPAGEEIPYTLRWFYGYGGGYSSGGRGGGYSGYYYRSHSSASRNGVHLYRATPPRLAADGSHVELVAGTSFVSIDLAQGQPTIVDMQHRPSTGPEYGDLDGDGRDDLLLLVSAAGTAGAPQLVGWSPHAKTMLWKTTLLADVPEQPAVMIEAPQWPVVCDLDHDGSAEVLLPGASSLQNRGAGGPPYGELLVLDGRTGAERWKAEIVNSDQQLDHFLPADDVDGDGQRDIVVASLWSSDFRLFVECLSGHDGSLLWRREHLLHNPRNESGDFDIAKLQWCGLGNDGWPQLALSLIAQSGEATHRCCLISSRDGSLNHLAIGCDGLQLADFDGDGQSDLLLESRDRFQWEQCTLQATRGIGQVVWQSTLANETVVDDLNGDGVRDLLHSLEPTVVQAYSGKSGEPLWTSQLDRWMSWATVTLPAQTSAGSHALATPQDLDGDGTPDLLRLMHGAHFQSQFALAAISGRSGRRLWQSTAKAENSNQRALVDCRDLDGDGRPEVIFAAPAYRDDAAAGARNGRRQLLLHVLAGDSGKTRWSLELTSAGPSAANFDLDRIALEPALGDLNGDGTLDLIVPAEREGEPSRLATLALDGRDGSLLWSCPLQALGDVARSMQNAPPGAIADLGGDAKAEAVVMSLNNDATQWGSCVLTVTALSGKDGRPRWTWSLPVNGYAHQVRPGEERGRLRPVPLRRADGKHWLAFTCVAEQAATYVLNEAGKEVSSQRAVARDLDGSSQIFPIDADGDGNDELVFIEREGLALHAADNLEKRLWQRRDVKHVLGLLAPHALGRLLVASPQGPQGLDVRNGVTQWTVAGTNDLAAMERGRSFDLLCAATERQPPLVAFQNGATTLVRSGTAPQTDIAEHWQATTQKAYIAQSLTSDPRLLRRLPWAIDSSEQLIRGVTMVAWSLFYAATLIALPVFYLAHLAKTRQWSLRTLLALPVIAGVALVGSQVHGPEFDQQTLSGKFIAGLSVGAPWLFAGYLLGKWMLAQRWRAIAMWMLSGIAVTVLVVPSLILVTVDARAHAGERWSWEGWYLIFFPGFFITATLTMWGSVIWWFVRLAWRATARCRTRTIAGVPA